MATKELMVEMEFSFAHHKDASKPSEWIWPLSGGEQAGFANSNLNSQHATEGAKDKTHTFKIISK